MHILYIYTTTLNYITSALTCFGASAPYSESFDIVFAKVIQH